MICKRMPLRRDGAAIACQVRSLLGYIDRAGRDAGRGGLVAQGGRNFIARTRSAQAEEMIATLTGCPRARQPLEHLVLSWRPDEQPDRRQVEEAVAILMRGLGLARHQVLWAQHADAAGVHLHLLVARVDPESGRPAVIRFLINALDRAVARIVFAQGWQPEAGARFEVVEELTTARETAWETARGEDDDGWDGSDERDGYDTDDWPGAGGDAEHGAGLARALGAGGAGRASGNGRDPVTAEAGWRRGPGRSDAGDRRVADAGRGAGGDDGPRDRGDAAGSGRAGRAPARDEAGAVDASRQDPGRAGETARTRVAALRQLGAAPRLRAEHWERQLGGLCDGPVPDPLPDCEATADRRARARARMAQLAGDDDHARLARSILALRLRGTHPRRWDDLPLARTLSEADSLSAPAAVQEVRRGERSLERVAIETAGPLIDAAASWPALHAALARAGIAYRRKGSGAVLVIGGRAVKASTYRKAALGPLTRRLGPYQPAADETPHDATAAKTETLRRADRVGGAPTRIAEAAPGTDPRMFAALRQARHRTALAQAQFAQACAPLPAASWRAEALLGARPPAAPDARTMADRLGLARPRLAPLQSPKLPGVDPASALGCCHAALRAERYGVLVRMLAVSRAGITPHDAPAAGSRTPAEPYDRLLQIPLGPLAALKAAWPRIAALARAGARVHLRFAARDQYHVVLRDLDAAGLERLQAEGHAAALVLETRPGLFDAVLRAPRGGSADEPAAVRRIGPMLARRYGCAGAGLGLRLCREPEAAAAATDGASRKPSVPARVIAWSGAVCERLAALIAQGARRLRAIRVLSARPLLRPWSSPHGGGGELLGPAEVAIYHAHRRNVLAAWAGRRPDSSRVDARVARRLRATGHGEGAVANLITACAATLEPRRRRDWLAYGRHAARLAFAPEAAGDADSRTMAAQVAAWTMLEQRARSRVEAVAALRSAKVHPIESPTSEPAVAAVRELAPIAADLPAASISRAVSVRDDAVPALRPPSIEPTANLPVAGAPSAAAPSIDADRPGQSRPSAEQMAALRPEEERLAGHLAASRAELSEASRGRPNEARIRQEFSPRDLAAQAADGHRTRAEAPGAEGLRSNAPVSAPAAEAPGRSSPTPLTPTDWDPLTDVIARDRPLVSYLVRALASGDRAIQLWRPYLRQALGRGLAEQVQTWYDAIQGEAEQQPAMDAVRCWTPGWNFNTVDRNCRSRGVRTPER